MNDNFLLNSQLENLIKYPLEFKIYQYLKNNALQNDGIIIFRNKCYALQKGQIITGRQNIAKALNIKDSQVRGALKRLKDIGIIEVKSTKRESIITIMETFNQG